MVDLGTTVTTIKAIAGVAKDAGKIDLYNDIINLQQTILELIADNTKSVETNARLTREVLSLREQLASAQAQLETRDALVFRNEAYWRPQEGEPDEGPFCARCYDGEGKVA